MEHYEAWDAYVGQQTVSEFLDYCEGDLEQDVQAYVETLHELFGAGASYDDYWNSQPIEPDDLVDLLLENITLERTR